MLTIRDLMIRANADVWVAIYDGEGNLLFEGDRADLFNSLSDCADGLIDLDFDRDSEIDDFWITEDAVLCVHVYR